MKDIFVSRFRWWSVGAVSVYLLFAYFHFRFGYYFWGQAGFSVGNDDAFITFRYARNLVEHGIPSFNLTDNPPVEGYSNPLYMLVSAAVYTLVGMDFLYPAMAGLGAVAVALAILSVGRFALETLGLTSSAVLMLSVALCPALWIHGTSGLETAGVFLAQSLLWIESANHAETLSKHRFRRIIFLSAILVLLRTDGFVFPFFLALWFFWRGQGRMALSILGTCLATFLLLMAARLAYYGLPMPLPYYVKVSGDLSGRLEVAARLIVSMAIKSGMALPLMAILMATLSFLAISLQRKTWWLEAPPLEVWLPSLLLAYYLYIGGDIYRDRFLVILFPMGIYALLKVLDQFGSTSLIIPFAGVAVVSGQLLTFGFDARLKYRFETPKYDRWITFGRFLANNHPDWLLATGAAGKLPYFSRLETIDMLGLNDRHIAMTQAQGTTPGHNKFDAAYVLSRKPDIICEHVFGNGMLTYGLDRPIYEAEGYRLRYMIRSRGFDGSAIVTLSAQGAADVTDLVQAGYAYGCVVKGAPS